MKALYAARAAGVSIRLDGDDLLLESHEAPPAVVLDLLSRHKAAIVARLRRDRLPWSAEDWQTFFDERAGVAEHDGGMPRARAEAMARESCIVEWQRQHPPEADGASCAACGSPVNFQAAGVLVLADRTTVHFDCHDGWIARRRCEAETALAVLGVIRMH
jgi:hypothetical protein